jgi:hypothetical protein
VRAQSLCISCHGELKRTSLLTPSGRFAPNRDPPWITIEPSDMTLYPLKSQILVVKAKVALFNGAIMRILNVSPGYVQSYPRSKKAKGTQTITGKVNVDHNFVVLT